jgi:hypothetical protein
MRGVTLVGALVEPPPLLLLLLLPFEVEVALI